MNRRSFKYSSSSNSSDSSILDRPIGKGKSEVALSSFSFLFGEIVKYSRSQSIKTDEIAARLNELGYQVGFRMFEAHSYRERLNKREIRLVAMLQYISNNMWKTLFGKNADRLQQAFGKEDEYHIFDAEPITNKFIPVPNHYGINCAEYVAGIIRGVLDAGGFVCWTFILFDFIFFLNHSRIRV
eukprot:gb/GECH01005409.1/.p1 GENE.gb/GECH01005409.1/~~gb/GECH01005409.1/.p1  ORF type:complete len:184 (+),score=24.83 gb/GECH01005409.1/:1-552(+)